jgi:hypothetical protein
LLLAESITVPVIVMVAIIGTEPPVWAKASTVNKLKNKASKKIFMKGGFAK